MFDWIKSLTSRLKLDAATQLAPIAPIKAKPGMRSWPAYFTSTKPSDAPMPKADRRLINTDTTSYRNGTSTYKVLSDMAVASPELSSALYTAIRLGVPEKYTAIARDMDGQINENATRLLQSLITRFDVIGDPLQGYVGAGSLKSISESLARDIMLTGQMTCELVLDKARMPYRLNPIASSVIEFKPDGDGVKPFQKVSGVEFDLDVPTVAIIQLDATLLTPYAQSPLESSLKAVVFSEMFMADLTRVMRRAIQPRMKVALDGDAIRKNLSPESQMDSEKATAEINGIIAGIESKVNGLNPEDALVYLSELDFSVETPTGAGAEASTLLQIANGKLASGAKTLPSVLGLDAGGSSSNISSTEVAIFLRSIDSSIRQKLNEMYSRLFSIAIRLTGADCYVTFEYEPLGIRPSAETEAFTQTRQMRLLEQLSLGFLGDSECSLMLTGKLPPAGFKPLSGTMFRTPDQQKAQDTASAQPATPTNDGSTLNQNLKPDTPSTARGQNKKKEKTKTAEVPNVTLNIDNTKQESASVIKMRRDEDGNLIVTKEAAA